MESDRLVSGLLEDIIFIRFLYIEIGRQILEINPRVRVNFAARKKRRRTVPSLPSLFPSVGRYMRSGMNSPSQTWRLQFSAIATYISEGLIPTVLGSWKNWRSRKSGRVGCKVSKSEECEWKLEFSSLSKAFSRIFNQSQQELRSLVRMKIIRIFVGILFGLQVFRTASGSAVRLVGLSYGL